MAYNSSHTGAQIDSAVGAVIEKESTWDGKQDKLTGTKGQIVGFDADGNAVAQDAPSTAKTYLATIGTTWTEDSSTGAKTQSVAISGVLATQTAKVDHAYTGSGTSGDYKAFVEAENQYLTYITNGYAETYDGGIKFTIFGDAPTVEIPIIAEVS